MISFSPSSFPGLLLSVKVFDEEAIFRAFHGFAHGTDSAVDKTKDIQAADTNMDDHNGSVDFKNNAVDKADTKEIQTDKQEAGSRKLSLVWETRDASPNPLQRQHSAPVTKKEKDIEAGGLVSRVSSWLSSAVGSGSLESRKESSDETQDGAKIDPRPVLKSPSPRKLKKNGSSSSSRPKDRKEGRGVAGEGEPTTPQSLFGQAMQYLPEQLRHEKGLAEKFEQGTQWLEESALNRFGRVRVEEAGGLQNFIFERFSNISRSAIGGVALLFMANVLFVVTVIIFDFAIGYYVVDIFTNLSIPHAKAVAFAVVGGANLVVAILVYLLGRASIANSTAGFSFHDDHVHDDDFDDGFNDIGNFGMYEDDYGGPNGLDDMEDGNARRRRMSTSNLAESNWMQRQASESKRSRRFTENSRRQKRRSGSGSALRLQAAQQAKVYEMSSDVAGLGSLTRTGGRRASRQRKRRSTHLRTEAIRKRGSSTRMALSTSARENTHIPREDEKAGSGGLPNEGGNSGGFNYAMNLQDTGDGYHEDNSLDGNRGHDRALGDHQLGENFLGGRGEGNFEKEGGDDVGNDEIQLRPSSSRIVQDGHDDAPEIRLQQYYYGTEMGEMGEVAATSSLDDDGEEYLGGSFVASHAHHFQDEVGLFSGHVYPRDSANTRINKDEAFYRSEDDGGLTVLDEQVRPTSRSVLGSREAHVPSVGSRESTLLGVGDGNSIRSVW